MKENKAAAGLGGGDCFAILKLSFAELRIATDNLTTADRDGARRALEAVAMRAGQMAAYLDERAGGNSCGDQGHRSAVKALNRAGRMIWRRVFGYNAYHDITF